MNLMTRNAETTETVDARPQVAGGKYLTFTLGHESYGIDVLKIREIIRLIDITPLPRMPEYIRGVINLRGKIIPVIDLRIRFQLAQTGVTERTCIVVVQVKPTPSTSLQMGLVVDAVEEVLNIGAGEVEATPDFGMQLDTEYILGMAKVKDRVKTLLNIDRVLVGEQLLKLGEAAGTAVQ